MIIIAFNRYWVIRWPWVLVNAVVVFMLLGLAFWQLLRADEKTDTLAKIAQWERQGAIGANQLFSLEYQSIDGVQVDFHAQWMAPMVWLLDNQTLNGRVGYDVIIPVQAHTLQQPILVNLGWVPAPVHREILPSVDLPSELRIQGILRTRVKGLLLGTNLESSNTWPKRVQQIDFRQLSQDLPQPLFFAVIYQQTQSPFAVHYHPVVLPPERHKAYALQWGLLAVAVVCIALAASMRKEAVTNE